MYRKFIILIFITTLFVLVGSYLIKDPGQHLRNFNQREIFDFTVNSLEKSEKYLNTFSLSKLIEYSTDRSLIDPAFVLPHYYLYSHEAIVQFVQAEKTCKNISDDIFKNLPVKFSLWLRYKCQNSTIINTYFLSMYPYMHPSGKSFALLLNEAPFNEKNGLNSRLQHILENQNLNVNLLWALTKGFHIIIDNDQLWIRQGPIDERDSALNKYKIYSFKSYIDLITNLGLEIKHIGNFGVQNDETFPAFQLEWLPMQMERNVLRQRLILGSSFTLICLLIMWLIILLKNRISEQYRRTFSFQLLAHELRTPVTSLKIEMDEVLNRYDELPNWTQVKVMRFADNLERLTTVIKASDNYIRSQKNSTFLKLSEEGIDSVNEMIEKIIESFSVSIQKKLPDEDCSINLDYYWVSFCISNLINNALQHGTLPIEVSWKKIGKGIKIIITDQGNKLLSDPRKNNTRKQEEVASQGLQIGLQMVDRITRELGGKLLFNPNPTSWTLCFPKAKK